MKKAILLVLGLLLCLTLLPVEASAEGHEFLIDDQAGLLTAEQAESLRTNYAGILDYASTGLVTTTYTPGSTASFAADYTRGRYGSEPATLFFIDMDDRQLYIFSTQSALSTISEADARAITDNVYRSASNGDYYECADQVFSQIQTKYQGGRIARPVKHITNALIAVVFGVLINFWLAARSRRPKKEPRTKGAAPVSVTRQMAAMPAILLAAPIVTKSERIYKSSDSGSGGGSGGGGGGGGGGGHGF